MGDLRVAHVSWHLFLREACNFLSKERILTALKLGLEAVQRMGIKNPRVAVQLTNKMEGDFLNGK